MTSREPNIGCSPSMNGPRSTTAVGDSLLQISKKSLRGEKLKSSTVVNGPEATRILDLLVEPGERN